MANSVKSLEWRYAVKKFDPEKVVSKKKILKLKQAFNLTATSYGLQPIKMAILHNKALQNQLIPFTYNQKQVAQASHLLIICIEKNISQAFIVDYFQRVKNVRGTEDSILNPFKEALINDFSKKKTEEIEEWATKQAYLALGNLMTVCALEKIDACPMEGFVPSGYDTLLGLEKEGLQSVLVMPIGYRAKDDIFSAFKKVRRNIEDSIIEIE